MLATILTLLVVALFAQNSNTPVYPTAAASDATLAVAARLSESTLATSINSSTLAVVVSAGTTFLNHQIIRIDNEEMQICSKSTNTLTLCTGTRGFNGTTAASHTAGVAVRGIITSWHHNQMAAEVKALTGALVPIPYSGFPGTCVASKQLQLRSDPATAGQILYACNSSGNGWNLVGDGSSGAASLVSFSPTGNVAATDVQAAIAEVDSEKAASSHTHAASAITNSAAGSIASTNVQDAVNELDTEKLGLKLYTALTGDLTLSSTNCGGLLVWTGGAFPTLTLPTPASVSTGCWFVYSVYAASALIVDASTSSINGTTGVNLSRGSAGYIANNGMGWHVVAPAFPTSNGGISFSAADGIYTVVPQNMRNTIPNAGTTGTTLFHMAKINSSAQAVITSTTDTTGAVGIVVSSAGTSGSATIQQGGLSTLYPETSAVAGQYVGLSATTAGRGTSSATCPSGQNIGVWVESGNNTSARIIALGNFCDNNTGGGGGAASFLANITDLKPTHTSSRLSIAAGRCKGADKSATYCDISSGTGSGSYTAYCTDSQTIVLEHSVSAGLTLSCAAGITPSQLTTPTIPDGMVGIASGSIVAGAPSTWGTPTDNRDWTAMGVRHTNGLGMNTQCANGVCINQVDSAIVQIKTDPITPVAAVDMSVAPSTKPAKTGTSLPGTCSVGEQFFKTDAVAGQNLYGCTSSNTWTVLAGADSGADYFDQTTSLLVDEFFTGNHAGSGSIGELKWSISNIAGSGGSATQTSEANHAGIVKVSSATSSGNETDLRLSTADRWDNKTFDMKFVFQIPTITDCKVAVGFANAYLGSDTNQRIAIKYDSATSDTVFKFETCSGGTCTTNNSTVSVVAGTWYRGRIRSTSAGTILFSVDGETEVSNSTNVPSTATMEVILAAKTNTAAARDLYVDWWALKRTGVSR